MIFKILLVDDHKLVRTGICHILEGVAEWISWAKAADRHSALKLACKVVPDVVLMDIQMPGMGGIETTRCMVRLLSDVTVRFSCGWCG